jgi:serine/threonine protein kinase
VQHTIQCYAGLEHDHILQFFVAFEDATFVYVVTELETGHEVQDLLRCHPSIPDAEVHGIAVAGVSALVYLHRKVLRGYSSGEVAASLDIYLWCRVSFMAPSRPRAS